MNEHHQAVEAFRSPYQRLFPTAPAHVKWTEGFWEERFQTCRNTMIPAVERALLAPDNGAVLSNFRVAAGESADRHRGAYWSDGDCYKWLEAVAHIYAATRDDRLDRLMDEYIDLITRSQEEDGYICTQVQLSEKKRWAQREYHELYNMGHLITAACVHYEATGKSSLLDVAIRTADFLHELFMSRPRHLVHYCWNPSNIMACAELYRVTGRRSYLELAAVFVDMRGSALGGDDWNQTRMPLREETEAVGHGVTATYLYAGAADVYAETGEQELLESVERLWENMIHKKMYITGAIGSYHLGVSSRRDVIGEALGREYELPNRTAYNETCANIGNAMLALRLLRLTGEAKYADVIERVVYNSMLSAVDLDGERFFYTNPLARAGKHVRLLSHDTRTRFSTHGCYCCPPQVVRTIAQLHRWAYSTTDEAIWCHLYGGSEFSGHWAGQSVHLVQHTDYPWNGAVVLNVKKAPGSEMTLKLRVPEWATTASVKLNGKRLELPLAPGSYAEIRRVWQDGDRVELDMPMHVRLIRAHALVEEARGQLAVMRGPIVYCLESADLPEGVLLDDVYIERGIAFSEQWEPQLLGGVVSLSAAALVVTDASPDALYREFTGDCAHVPVKLVPYFTWNNRGEGEMRVWQPVI